MSIFFLVLFIAASVSQLAACFFNNKKWRSYNKPLVMASLLGFYVTNGCALSVWIVLALMMSLVGDIMLIFKKLFLVGSAFFLLAHVSYIVGFSQRIDFGYFKIWQVFAVAVLYATYIVVVLGFLSKTEERKLYTIAPLYFLPLCTMSCFAAFQLLYLGTSAASCIFIGSLFFVASDTLISIRQLRKDIKIPFLNVYVMLTYVIAQFLIIYGTINLDRIAV